jgi:probable phosphoglycerate mutase
VTARADRVIARIRKPSGHVALFSHGHFLRVLASRWIGLGAEAGEHFLRDTATLGILGHYGDSPAVQLWNAPLTPRHIGGPRDHPIQP